MSRKPLQDGIHSLSSRIASSLWLTSHITWVWGLTALQPFSHKVQPLEVLPASYNFCTKSGKCQLQTVQCLLSEFQLCWHLQHPRQNISPVIWSSISHTSPLCIRTRGFTDIPFPCQKDCVDGWSLPWFLDFGGKCNERLRLIIFTQKTSQGRSQQGGSIRARW